MGGSLACAFFLWPAHAPEVYHFGHFFERCALHRSGVLLKGSMELHCRRWGTQREQCMQKGGAFHKTIEAMFDHRD